MLVSVEQTCQTVVTLNQINVGGKEKPELFNWNIIETVLNISDYSCCNKAHTYVRLLPI